MAEDDMRQQVDEIVRKQFEVNGVPAAQQDEPQVQAAVKQALNPWLRYFLINRRPVHSTTHHARDALRFR